MTDFVSIWLVPSQEILEPLQHHIEVIAARNNAQPFVPHVTLLSGVAPCEVVCEVVASVCDDFCRITQNQTEQERVLPITGQLQDTFIGTGEYFYHALGYGFAYHLPSVAVVLELTQSIQTGLLSRHLVLDPVPNPHISMLYLEHQAAQCDFDYLREQCVLLPKQGQAVVLDSLFIVRGSGPIRSQQDVADWQVRARLGLLAR